MYFRKELGHQDLPQEVAWSCDFYVTICAEPRRQNHFCRDPVGSAVLSSARHYQNLSKWGVHLLLLMPDHRVVCSTYAGYVPQRKRVTQQHLFRAATACTLLARFLGFKWHP
jgi:hypothetical protein